VGVAKAVTKGYAICSAAFASIILFSIYNESLKNYFPDLDVKLSLGDIYVLVGLFIGGLLPYLLSSMSMKAVLRVAGELVMEVRRQLKSIKGLIEGKAKPEYRACVDLLAKKSLKEMVIPAIIPFASPFMLYYTISLIIGKTEAFSALGSMLLGVIVSSIFIAISMTSGGGAWENANKYIADGNHGGEGSKAYDAAKAGDMVGSVYKDVTGATLSPMIKIVNVVAILLLAIV
jgi:K(+)-stimulated pyrophosphate-energized sodium pump